MKPEDITDDELKERMIEDTFNKQTVFSVFAGMPNNIYINYAHQVAKNAVDKTWETITGSQIDELKAQMAAEEKGNGEG